MPPLVCVVGKSNSGKTVLIEKLVRELESRGYRVATIKHVPEAVRFDEPGTDSWRHLQAGSEATVIASPNSLWLAKPVSQDAGLDEAVRLLGEDQDIILAEGFKEEDAPKIEVHRKEVGPPLDNIRKLFAIVTDEPLESRTRQFSQDDIAGIADLLVAGFVRPQEGRLSLRVNGDPVTLTVFPRQIIGNVLMAMVSCLKGVGQVRSLQIFFKKEAA